jgi:hypothetical protein
LEDRRISAKSIGEHLGISRERVGSIIHEDLDMFVACFLPGRANDLSAPLYSSQRHTQFVLAGFSVQHSKGFNKFFSKLRYEYVTVGDI